MKYIFASIVWLLLFHHSLGQHLLSPVQAHEDLTILRQALETVYPSTYRYTDSVTLTQYFDDLIRSAPDSQSYIALDRRVVATCAKLNDEHLIPSPPLWYYDSLKRANHFFPFSIKLIDGRMYVLHGFHLPPQLPVGSEILSINGRSAEEVLNRLLPTIPSDGYLQTFKVRHLEDYSMTQNENLFDLNYPLFVEDVDSFHLQYLSAANKKTIRSITIAGLDYFKYQQFYRERRPWKAPLEFDYLGDDVAYLRIYSFQQEHRDAFHQDFPQLYDSIFNILNKKGTRHLILDLRNNEGGDNTGQELLRYLMTKPYRLLDYLEARYTGYPTIVNYLENKEESVIVDSFVYKTPSGMYRLKKQYADASPQFLLQHPSPKHFKGSLYVLINGATGSMAGVVASFLKGYSRAVFIGEESGSAMEGPTSIAYAHLLLPNSKIRVEIPLIKTVHLLTYEKGRGVIPDYTIEPKLSNLLKQKDDELTYALKLIHVRK